MYSQSVPALISKNVGNTLTNYKTWGGILINVKDTAYGAKGDANFSTGVGTDDTAAIQKAIQAAYDANGGTVYFPPGQYKITSPLLMDQSTYTTSGNAKRPSIIGAGSAFTTIWYTGTDKALYFLGGRSGEGHHSYQTIQGLCFVGGNLAGTSAMTILNAAFLRMKDVRLTAFDYGMYLQDVENCLFEDVDIRFNMRGIFARQNPTPYAASTEPNSLTFLRCHLGSNKEYGGYFNGGSVINWIGGSVEGNGVGGTSGLNHGLRFDDAGFQGNVGCSIIGVYFEHNKGAADISLYTGLDGSTFQNLNGCAYLIEGCSFTRLSNTEFVTHNIWATFKASTAGPQMLTVLGCGFKKYGTYVADATRQYIYFDTDAMSQSNRYFAGNMMYDAAEAVQQENDKPTVTAFEITLPQVNFGASVQQTLTFGKTYKSAPKVFLSINGVINFVGWLSLFADTPTTTNVVIWSENHHASQNVLAGAKVEVLVVGPE